jgi:hypothetical protein
MLGPGDLATRSGKLRAYASFRTVPRARPVARPIASSASPARCRRRTSSYTASRRARWSALAAASARVRG